MALLERLSRAQQLALEELARAYHCARGRGHAKPLGPHARCGKSHTVFSSVLVFHDLETGVRLRLVRLLLANMMMMMMCIRCDRGLARVTVELPSGQLCESPAEIFVCFSRSLSCLFEREREKTTEFETSKTDIYIYIRLDVSRERETPVPTFRL